MADVMLSLLVLRSPDVERAARFYGLLGIRFERERHGTGPEHLAAQLGPAVLEIYPQDGQADSVGVRLGFRVASVDAVIEAMRREGQAILSLPRRTPWGYRAVLTDPDGRRIEVSEGEASEPRPVPDWQEW
jgi:predicted enzyme related to lactoylglutathione lyase